MPRILSVVAVICLPAALLLIDAFLGPEPPPPTLSVEAPEDAVLLGRVGGPLGDSLRVTVTEDGSGRGAAGVTVRWQVVSGGGSLSPDSSLTDASGVAAAQWILGPEAGEQAAAATVPGVSPTPVRFVAIGSAGTAARLAAEQPVSSDTVALRVLDEFGNPVTGVTVSWTAASSAGTVNPESSVSDADGLARTFWVTRGSAPDSIIATAGEAGGPTTTLVRAGVAAPAPSWFERMSGTPPARYAHAITYDATRNAAILFGGAAGSGRLQDTWSWDRNGWTQLAAGGGPPAREQHGLAFRASADRVVLFGGLADDGPRNDTWLWNGTAWSQANPSSPPSPRSGHALAFDEARDRVLLFGGLDASGSVLDDTWQWDGVAWTAASGASGPAARVGHSMVYDSGRRRVVLFGGSRTGDANGVLADTWEWDGTGWTERNPAFSPPGRFRHMLEYDRNRQRVVLFGGVANERLDDTWEWDGDGWAQRNPDNRPSARESASLIYDRFRRRLVLYGGRGADILDDTWEFRLP